MKQKKVEIAVENNNDFVVNPVKNTPFSIVEKQGVFYISIGNQLVSSKNSRICKKHTSTLTLNRGNS